MKVFILFVLFYHTAREWGRATREENYSTGITTFAVLLRVSVTTLALYLYIKTLGL